MAAITVQDAHNGLAAVTFAAANAGGDTVLSGARMAGWEQGVWLVVNNGDVGDHTVTVAGLPAVTVTGGEIGLVPVYGFYKDRALAVTYDGVTSVTVAAVRLGPPLS